MLEGLAQARGREFATDAEVEAALRGFGRLLEFLRGSVAILPEIDLTTSLADEAFAAEEGDVHR